MTLIRTCTTTTGVVCTLTKEDDDYIMVGGTGTHRLYAPTTDHLRLEAHWNGFVQNNGGYKPRLLAGEAISVFRNQGDREAEVLAVLGDEALIEYVMPNGTSALNIVSLDDWDQNIYRTVSYYNVPTKWANAITEQTGPWVWGNPQRKRLGPVPQPWEN